MTAFYLTLLTVYMFSLLARIIRNKYKKLSWIFVIIVILILTLVSGLRDGIGDTSMYEHLYTLITPEYDANGGYEAGFIFFLKFLKTISEETQFMVMVISIIINVLMVIAMYIFTEDGYFEIAIFLYVTSGYYIVTMNGMRQAIAGAILFISTIFIIKRKFILYLIVCLLMITIHQSAFVMIPIYFIVREKAWHKKTNILFGMAIVGLLFYDPIMSLLGDSKYGGYASSNEGGANIIRVAIYMVPVVLSYLKKENIFKEWKDGDIFVNMTTICGIIMLFSAVNWIFARFTIYFQPYNFIVFAFMFKNSFKSKEKRLIYFGLMVCYFLFFYYDNAVVIGVDYKSNFNLYEFLYY